MDNNKWSGSNPWLGLAPYTEGTPLYGRTQESFVLSEIIKDNIASIVYGKSGIGKSSLLSAGISPMLRSEQYIPVPLRLVHNTEISYVEQIENRVRELVDCKDELPDTVPDLGLWDFFHRNTFTKDGTTCKPVIILDQFEEIYTLTDVEHKPEIIALFTELASLLNDIKPDTVLAAEASFTEEITTSSSTDDDFSFELSTESSFAYKESVNFRFVICLREDKLYLLERNSANIPSIKTNRYNLQALSPESALEVITCPRPGLFTIEEATAIIDKLADMGDEGIRTVDPAILSLFLYKYYEKKGEANYDNIFADYYHEATKDIRENSLAFLEDHLLTLGGYRNQIPLEDAISCGVLRAEIAHLLKNIIIRIEKRKGIEYIEISHDRLCAEAMQNRIERQNSAVRKSLIIKTLSLLVVLFVIGTISFGVSYINNINTKNSLLAENKHILMEMQDSIQAKNKELHKKNDELKAKNIIFVHRGDSLLIALDENTKKELKLTFKIQELRNANEIINKQRNELELWGDSISKVNDRITEALLSRDSLKDILGKNTPDGKIVIKEPINKTDIFNQVYYYCCALRDSIYYWDSFGYIFSKSKRDNALISSARRLKDYIVPSSDLKCTFASVDSLDTHWIFNTEFIEDLVYSNTSLLNSRMYNEKFKQRSYSNNQPNKIHVRNCMIKGHQSINLTKECHGGHNLFGLVTEPGGSVYVQLYDEEHGIYYPERETTSKLEGKSSFKQSIYFPLTIDKKYSVKIKIQNTKKSDCSFIILTD